MSRPDAPPELDLPGGGYQLRERLGQGAFGEVWRAEAPGGVEVAVKIIHRVLKPQEAQRELEAMQLIKRLRHQGLLSVQAFFMLPERLIVILELADRSLGQRLSECQASGQPGIPGMELLRYFMEAAEALDYLHSHQVQHRDVKPDNILLLGRHAKVADYGLARLLEKQALESATTVGTPAYMAPEVWTGKISGHSDQYSLAVAYAHLHSGRLPFAAEGLAQMMVQHLSGAPDLATFVEGEQAVLRRALAREPGERYSSCTEFVRALLKVARGKSPQPEPTAVPRPAGPAAFAGRDAVTLARRPRNDTLRADERPQRTPVERVKPRPAAGETQPRGPKRWRVALLALVGTAAVVALAVGLAIVLSSPSAADRSERVDGREGDVPPPSTRAQAPVATQPALLTTRPALEGGGTGTAMVIPKVAPPLAQAPFDAQRAQALQQAWATYLGREVEKTVSLGGGVSLELVLIPPGSFTMGSPASEPNHQDDEVEHPVTISRPYYLAKYPVTQAQYERLLGNNPSYFSAESGGKDKVRGLETGRFPVEQVSWDDASAFCVKLGERLERRVSLPTEAEWEYACRAGTRTPFCFGAVLNGVQANCAGTSPYGTSTKGPYLERTSRVGSYAANGFGLCDMHGNVWQWCEDWYGPYGDLASHDPLRKGPIKDKEYRVLRGGSWVDVSWICRAAYRDWNAPSYRVHYVGFRVVVRLD